MNIVERARSFRQSLQALAQRTTRAWQECPHCGSWLTIKNGSYQRHPWHLSGRVTVRVHRHLCQTCGRRYGEQAPQWVRGSLVWPGRAAGGGGSLATSGFELAADGRGVALMVGAARALAALAPLGFWACWCVSDLNFRGGLNNPSRARSHSPKTI